MKKGEDLVGIDNRFSSGVRCRGYLILLAAGTALCACPSLAQTAPRAQAAASNADEIVVTAQKRAENVQDVPKSVTVASQAILEKQGVSRLNDLAAVFPNLTVTSNYQNQKPPGIRGVTTFANAVSVQAQTGIIIDDIPQPTFSTLAYELVDIERVEVFAGPQSTLSGRNAAGGLINFVTRAPGHEPAAEFHLEQTTDAQTKATAFVTAPLSKKIAFSVSALYDKWRGPVSNLVTGKHAQGYESAGVRGKLRFELTDDFTATLTGYYLHTDRVTTPILGGGVYIDVAPGATHSQDASTPKRTFSQLYPGMVAEDGNRHYYSFQDGSATNRDRGGTVRLDYNFGSIGTLSSLTNYSRSNQPRNDIFLGAPQTNVLSSVTSFNATTDVATKYLSQEVRLVSPGHQKLTYLLGAIYTDSDLAQPYYRYGFLPAAYIKTSQIKSIGLFGRATYNVTHADSVTGGVRYQHDHQGYSWQFFVAPAGAYTQAKSGYGFFAGEASYKHDFTQNINAYVTVSHSETGQAYDTEDQTTAAVKPLTPLASEKVNNVEVGLKSQLFDRRLTFNVDVYRADYKNYQVQTIDSSNTLIAPVIRTLAIGKVRAQGVEVTTSFRASTYLRLGASGIYNDARIRDYPLAACYVRQTAAQGCVPAIGTTPANQGNLKGKPLQAAPKFKVNANIDYTLPLNLPTIDLSAGATYRYESKSNFNILFDPAVEQHAFSVVNIYTGATTKDGKYSLQLFVNNLFNKVFYNEIRNESQINARSAYYDRNSFRYGGARLTAKF